MDFARRTSSGAVLPLLVHLAKSISSLSTSDYSFLREIPPLCLAAFFSRMASFFCLFDLGGAFCTFFCSLFAIQDLPFNMCSNIMTAVKMSAHRIAVIILSWITPSWQHSFCSQRFRSFYERLYQSSRVNGNSLLPASAFTNNAW